MPWVRLDDQFADHPKILAAGPLASWLYVCGLTYAARLLTDGFIPAGQVRKLADVDGAKDLAETLVRAGLWDATDGGYTIHDYLIYNPSAAKVKHERAMNAARQQEWRERGKERDGGRDSAVSNTVSDADRNGVTDTVTNTRPVPTPIPVPNPTPQEKKTTPNGVAAKPPPAALTDRQIKHREMFGALSETFGKPSPGPERERYERAAKDLVTAGALPSEVPRLYEAWGWANPGVPRVNSLAGQLTILRQAKPPGATGRASPNGRPSVDRATNEIRTDVAVRYRSNE